MPESSKPTSEKRKRAADAPRAPRSQQVRSREARETLTQATIDALIERGYTGLSIKEVAERAGLSRGALAHHYPSKAELVVAACDAVYGEALSRGQRLAKSPRAVRDPIGSFIVDCSSVYFDWPFLAALEIIVVARTDPQLMRRIEPVMVRYRAETNDTWLEVFEQAGHARADAQLRLNLTLNLVRGMAVNLMWQPSQRLNRWLLKEWTPIIRAAVAASAPPAE